MMATVADPVRVDNGLVLAVLIIYRQPPVRGVRRLIRRELLAAGCAELGLAAYMLPRSATSTLETLATRVADEGGSASVCELYVSAPKECQFARRFFDRSTAYAGWLKNADRFQSHFHLLTGGQLAHSLKQLRGSWTVSVAETFSRLIREFSASTTWLNSLTCTRAKVHGTIAARCCLKESRPSDQDRGNACG